MKTYAQRVAEYKLRWKEIYDLHYQDKWSLNDLAKRYKISRQRVVQIIQQYKDAYGETEKPASQGKSL